MNLEWKQRYLKMAKGIAEWSKDPSRQIGAVAINDKKQILAAGYNGFPRGIEDSPERYADRPTKYKFVVHAEMNVIYNACHNGVSLNDAILFVWGLPICSECAKGIIQVGVKSIIMPKQEIPDQWKASWDLSAELFSEAAVNWEFIEA